MDGSTPGLAWVLIVSGVVSGALLAMVGGVFAWQQRQAAAQARQWGQHLLQAQEEERQRIARDLHDDVVQRLLITGMSIEQGNTPAAMSSVREIAATLRGLSHQLHPPALAPLGLGRALQDLTDAHAGAGLPSIELSIDPDTVVNEQVGIVLYRVAQEGLANARKHARAQHIKVQLSHSDNATRMLIEDDGIGYLSTAVGHSFGIRSMRERLRVIGGDLEILSSPGNGTRLVAMVPAA